MFIGINGYEAVVPRFGFDKNNLPVRVGSGEVAFWWLKYLSKIDMNNSYTIYLPTEPTPDMPKESSNWKYKIIRSKRLWTILGLTRVLRGEKLDVFFSPTHYAPLFVKFPQVITILDVSYKRYPKLFTKLDLLRFETWGKYSIKIASKIITISNSSKDDIIKEYGIPEAKVEVVYPGIKQVSSSKYEVLSMKQLKQKYGIDSPFILFVGTLQPRKNVKRLIEAFSNLVSSMNDLKLVIVGRKGWQYRDILEAPKKFNIEDKVKFIETVTDEELPSFYKNAEVFVLPSLYEGFGLPILESMRYGCPVVTSNVSSLPEAGGDAALYVDPNNVADIAEKLEKVLTDDKLRDKMIEKGNEQYKKFTWEKSAKKVLQVLEETAGPVSSIK